MGGLFRPLYSPSLSIEHCLTNEHRSHYDCCMKTKKTLKDAAPLDDWAAKIAALEVEPAPIKRRKKPITQERIKDAALAIIASEGYQALTMRRIAVMLETGAASLYAHVRDKAALDSLLVGALCAQVTLPEPDPTRWSTQFKHVCQQLRDLYLAYPGISLAAFATAQLNLDTLRINEGLMGILLAGGIPPQSAAWAIDAAILYVGGYSLERSMRHSPALQTDTAPVDKTDIIESLQMLPAHHFPHTLAHIQEITSGEEHQRFDFTLELLLHGLSPATK